MPCVRAAIPAAFLLLFITVPAPAADPALRPVLDGLRARSIGPATMGGRICDLAVVESNPNTFYFASAGGGVWKTTDAGDTFTPLFDDQPTMSIGSVAVCQAKPDVVYVGTGEGNPRNSVSPGNGVYKSSDGGKTWTHCGLADTQHIGRVVVHPTNPDVAYVAAMGHFWGPNKERGLYKTIDGGTTWTISKFIDENTGFIDLQMDPSDPETLYAAAWEVRRDGFSGGNPITGTGSKGGLFKSTDGGTTWSKLTEGLPKGAYGRCGLSVYRKDPNIVYAVVQTDKTIVTVTGQMPPELTKGKVPGPGTVEIGGVFKSTDKGKTWTKVNDIVPRPFYYGQIRVDPTDDQRVYCLGIGFYLSTDGGKTFASRQLAGVHSDHHALWINPANADHVILGNDGGLYVSKDRTKTFTPIRTFVISQFYGVGVDLRTPYRVYGGLQDNGSWGAPVATAYPDGLAPSDWQRVGGGDGFQAAVDPTDPNIVYVESQYGGFIRVDVSIPLNQKGRTTSIRPPSEKGITANRWNWNCPILISPHNPKTIYYGSQFVWKSTQRGDQGTWKKISPDLSRAPADTPITNNGHNLTVLAESPVTAGVIWAGTDDGNLWVTKNDGLDWIDLTKKVPNVPIARTISRVEPSPFDAGTAFLAIDRHRNDDFKPYIFKTTDFGETWIPLVNGLPTGAYVGVVRQSSKNKNLLFAGTELGLYVSLDGGQDWLHLNGTGLPATVRVDDVVIHPTARELVIGTHGRGIWILDIAPLEQLTPDVLKADAHLFDVKPVTLVKEAQRPSPAARGFTVPNPPRGIAVSYLLGSKGVPPLIELRDAGGNIVGFAGKSGKPKAGLYSTTLDVDTPGEYTVTLKLGDKVIATKKATVKGETAKKADE